MLPVTERLLSALGKPQDRVTRATITLPGEEPLNVPVAAGMLYADSGTAIRRRVTAELVASGSLARAIEADGATLAIEHGLNFGGTLELIPVFTGEVLRASQAFGDGAVRATGVDFGHWVSEARFPSPRELSGARSTLISDLVTEAKPDATVADESTSSGTALTAVWPRSRADAIAELTRDGTLDAFFRGDGSFLIRDAKTLASSADYTVRGGPGGTLKSGERLRPLDRRYNAVVVTPATGEQEWTQQSVQVTDTSNPRHPDRIGLRPYFYASPSISSAENALAVAQQILDRVLGNTQTLRFASVSNPALEEGDVVRVVVPSLNRDEGAIYQHFIDSFALNLASGEMTAQTRSQRGSDE